MHSRRGNPKYDWAAIQRYFEDGHTYKEFREKFGFSAAAWTNAVRRGALVARARALPVATMVAARMSRRSIKRRLLELGTLVHRCSICGLTEWRGKRLTIQIDHINGIKDDWRREPSHGLPKLP